MFTLKGLSAVRNTFLFFLYLSTDDPLASMITSRPIHRDSSSPECFEMVSNWLQECRESHQSCGKDDPNPLPTRVIDVGDKGVLPRLIETNGKIGNWVALSHCWGQDLPSLRTKTETLSAWCKELPGDDIPLTWKDAIFITKRLGYKYLWIDSLCIIQDSKQDWLTESSRMQLVYKHASFTIAAEASVDSKHGIFKSSNVFRSHNSTSSAVVPCRSSEDNLSGILLARPPLKSSSDCRGPLSTRAWTLQEYSLSRRVLLYTCHYIYWSCLSQQYCESHSTTQNHPKSRWDSAVTFKIPQQLPLVEITKYTSVSADWYILLNEYANRNITFDRDRLPAISGLAKEFAATIETPYNKYCAGIWQSDFRRGLLWRALWTGLRRSAEYVAPSWSWASMSLRMPNENARAAVSLYDRDLNYIEETDEDAIFLKFNVCMAGEDSFGEVLGGTSIRIRARCREISYIEGNRVIFDGMEDEREFREAQAIRE
jgi:hypothetical protein